MRTRILLFLTGLILVPVSTYFVILFARGYRPDFRRRELSPTGILATTSLPDSAQILINGLLTTATNSNLNLSPGTYKIDIKKEGFQPWSKSLSIEKEIVTRAAATLFPSVPSLKAITTTTAAAPTLSPDGTKVAYLRPTKTLSQLYTLDLSESPLGLLNRDPRLIISLSFLTATLIWSPDSKQILVLATPSASLVDISTSQVTDATSNQKALLASWTQLRAARETQKFSLLPLKLQSLLATSAANLVWSPKENKLLYTATASATIPDRLIPPLPGSSTQPQSRALIEGGIYIYDLEEDRNFKIENCKSKIENRK